MDFETLVSELRRLVGHGAHARRLSEQPRFRSLAGVSDDTPLVEAGNSTRRFFIRVIDSLEGMYQFDGREVEANKVKRALRWLLAIDGKYKYAPDRRFLAMKALGAPSSIEAWRRPFGLERELLTILAEALVNPPEAILAPIPQK